MFKKNFHPKPNVFSPNIDVYVEQFKESLDSDGSIQKSRNIVKKTAEEISSKLPKRSDYTIEKLLAANVPLKEVPTNLLNKTDRYITETLNENKSLSILNQLLEQRSKDVQEVEKIEKVEINENYNKD